ncbi:hypothetical protein C0J45_2705 [Silurus meridionalis]|nr:hypothetical protein C0J45_2705 [Silurus meridionalis]
MHSYGKVCFSKEVTVHILEEWPIESQEAQDESCWMEMAIDRQRFKRRVELTEKIISLLFTVTDCTIITLFPLLL